MGRILAIDFGTKRVGLAVTDPLKMIANPLDTVPNSNVIDYIQKYIQKEDVELIVIGMPKSLQNEDTHATGAVIKFIATLKNKFDLPVKEVDERFTSSIAFQSMLQGGLKKKDRQNKATIDKVSATLILQSYLEANPN